MFDKFDKKDALKALKALKIDVLKLPFPLKSLVIGMNVETEHGNKYPLLNIGAEDPIVALKIALAHLIEKSDYYKILLDAGL